MNGWQRLYVVAMALVAAPVVLLVGNRYPGLADAGTIYACELVDSAPSPSKAAEYLRIGEIPSGDRYSYPPVAMPVAGDCRKELEGFVRGTRLGELRAAWWRSAAEAIGYFLLFAGVVYLLGMAVGWVWHGFFPRKPY